MNQELVWWIYIMMELLWVIHKPRGQIIGYFQPPIPSWSLELNKVYVTKKVIWLTPYPTSPQLVSTWFMYDPLLEYYSLILIIELIMKQA